MKIKIINPQKRFWVLSILVMVLMWAGCSTVSVPHVKQEIGKQILTREEIRQAIKSPPVPAQNLKAQYSPFPKKKPLMLKAGDKSIFGVSVTQGMEKAYRYYLAGDGEKALMALAEDEKTAEESGLRWQTSFFKTQILLMMGQAAEAELELEKTAALEIDYIGHDLNSIALRAEIKTWMEDFDGALKDLALVIKTIGNWELPISYSSFPTNRDQLYILTTAKLRAYTTLTAIYIFLEDYQSALNWGKETERLFNNVHFVINHSLYGAGDSVHADSYYGRALNLTFLASATLAINQDLTEAEGLFNVANGFYDAIGFTAGQVTTAALKARILNRLGLHDLCYEAGQTAMKMAIDAGLPDYVWRIGILTGKTLLAQGRIMEAELAFRQAQASVDQISGGLSADRAKIRFGVGKEDITYHLSQLDIQKKDWAALFKDLEIGRARAFVDMLRDRPVIAGRHSEEMARINELEREIRALRLKNMAPGKTGVTELAQEKSLLDERLQLVQELQTKDPELAELVTVSVKPLKETQQSLADGEMIAYFIPARSEDNIRFLRITNVSVDLETLLITAGDLEKQLDDFSYAFFDPEALENRGIYLAKQVVKDEEPVTPEYAINTLQKSLRIGGWGVQKNLYVVATGILHFMPWGILETTFPISVLPTGGWLSRPSSQELMAQKIVIVGDPDFGGVLPQLAGAREEAKQLAKIYSVNPLLGAEATEMNLREKVGRGVQILHFATHGRFDGVSPLQSALYLTGNRTAYALTAKKLYESPIPAKLVILSACETGLGKTVAGDDLLGLSRSFYLGSTRTILSSLWEIEDEGTKEFMLTFHNTAANGNYGKAWVEAIKHVKADGFPASVYGAFNLNGRIR